MARGSRRSDRVGRIADDCSQVLEVGKSTGVHNSGTEENASDQHGGERGFKEALEHATLCCSVVTTSGC
jgi:hypothetical protein